MFPLSAFITFSPHRRPSPIIVSRRVDCCAFWLSQKNLLKMSAVCASNLHLFVFSQLALMVFRLPTPFESFVPASSDPISLSRPWRGTFSLHGVNLFHPTNGQQRLFVASAETEGNK